MSPSLIGHLASVDVKHNVYLLIYPEVRMLLVNAGLIEVVTDYEQIIYFSSDYHSELCERRFDSDENTTG